MAITTLQGGWGEGLVKQWVDANFAYLLTLDTLSRITSANIKSVIGKAQTEFQDICNANMAVIHAAYPMTYTQLLPGDSWADMKIVLNANFTAATAAFSAATPSAGTPSDTPSSSPSAGTPSDTPSSSPSATPSSSPS